MSHLNTNFDNDLDSFLNLDHNDFTPISTPAVKPIPSLSHQSSAVSSNSYLNSQQSFSGPSYQYDSHRQQTGLPIGGLANTFAINQANGLHFRGGNMGFVMPTETLNVPLSNLDDFDFNQSQSLDMSDMDFDAESPSDFSNIFYQQGSQSGQQESSAAPRRMYPGSHSQQAAQAKAAQAQRQQNMLLQQEKQIEGQRPLPTQAPKAKDPHVEESISRLLSKMRQGSASTAEEQSPSSPDASGIARLKKDEEDMDEDERLLASEEGKKLSSKERRQLRNKVSARAFRSRRKEYIGQLEGEVAARTQEANELRTQNRQLAEENTRLTDLTRMLLSSQAFSGFLQELSQSGIPSSISKAQNNQPSYVQKDVSTHDAAQQLQSQNQQHVGMTLVPETNLEMPGMELPMNNWTAPLPSNDFQVYSITCLPQPPSLDLEAMTEKPSTTFDAPVKSLPELPSLPAPKETAVAPEPEVQQDDSVSLDRSDFDLYYDSPATLSTESHIAQIPANALPEHATSLTSTTQDSYRSSWSSLQSMCNRIKDDCATMENLLPQAKF